MRLWPRRGEERTLTPPRLEQGPYVYLAPDTSALSPTTALATPNVYACVRVLADAAAACPLIPYRRLADDERRRAGGRVADLLKRPAEDVTQADLISTVMTHLLLWGNAYVGKYRDADGRVEQLLPIDPSQVTVERRSGRITFELSQDGRTSEHGLDDLIHVKSLSTDGLVGLSPIRMMRLALELDNATRVASTTLFTNNARPSGILHMHRGTQAQAEMIKAQWQDGHFGDQAGGIAILSSELTFTPLSMPADDAQYVEARRLSATEVCRCFRVPPWLVAAEDTNTMTYSNTENQMLSFVTLSLRPWLTAIEQAISADRDLFGPSSFAEFLIDSLLRADSKTRSEIYSAALNPVTGWMRRDEVRRLENLEPEPDAVQLPAPSMNGEGAVIA